MKAALALGCQFLQGANAINFISGTIGLMALGGTCASGGPYEIQTQCTPFVTIALVAALPLFFLLLFMYSWARPKAWTPMGLWPAGVMMLGVTGLFLLSAIAAALGNNIGQAVGAALLALMMAAISAGGVWLFTARARRSKEGPLIQRPGGLAQLLAAIAGVVAGIGMMLTLFT